MDTVTIETLTRPNIMFPLLFFGFLVVSVTVKGTVKCVTALAKERSRREIAAYIAEGTISADQGERLMKAEPRSMTNCAS